MAQKLPLVAADTTKFQHEYALDKVFQDWHIMQFSVMTFFSFLSFLLLLLGS